MNEDQRKELAEWRKSHPAMAIWQDHVEDRLRLVLFVLVAVVVIFGFGSVAGYLSNRSLSHKISNAALQRSEDNADTLKRIEISVRTSTQQAISARYVSCKGGNVLRAALRQDVRDSEQTVPLLYKLLPQLDTPAVRQFVAASNAKKLQAYADQDCQEVALAIVPKGERKQYHVP